MGILYCFYCFIFILSYFPSYCYFSYSISLNHPNSLLISSFNPSSYSHSSFSSSKTSSLSTVDDIQKEYIPSNNYKSRLFTKLFSSRTSTRNYDRLLSTIQFKISSIIQNHIRNYFLKFKSLKNNHDLNNLPNNLHRWRPLFSFNSNDELKISVALVGLTIKKVEIKGDGRDLHLTVNMPYSTNTNINDNNSSTITCSTAERRIALLWLENEKKQIEKEIYSALRHMKRPPFRLTFHLEGGRETQAVAQILELLENNSYYQNNNKDIDNIQDNSEIDIENNLKTNNLNQLEDKD